MSRTMLPSILLIQVDLFFQVFTSFALVADSNVEPCGNIADVVFVIDSSSSIWETYFHQQLEFVKQMVNTFDVGQVKTRIGALSFSSKIVREFHLKTYDSKQRVLDAISEVEYTAGDATNTHDALRVLRTEYFSERSGDRSDIPNIAILLTDGESFNMADTVNEANLTRETGVTVFAIGIGHSVNKEELNQIASSPKSDYMYVLENFTELQSEAFKKLISHQACKTLGNASVEQTCKIIADVVFVIDASRSIWINEFRQKLDFVKQVVNAFDVGQGKTRIGAVNFSNRVMTEFHLKTYDSKQDVLNAISSIEYTAGDSTNTFDALRVLRTEHFSEINGDRPDVPNIAIFLTDGESHNVTSTVNEANLTREAGVAIFAIGIGYSVNKEELENIASSPKSDYMHILENFTDLQTDAFTKLLINKTCKVLVNDSNEKCTRIDDVVFVIDSSSSIWEPYFKQQLEFVKQVINAFDVGQGKTRIGAVNFSNRVMTEFHLKTYDSKQDVLNAISSIEYTAGDSTNTFDALRVLRTEHFREINGDRSDVPNIAILLTDGESYNMNSTVNEAKLTKEADVTIFAIGIGYSVNKEELENIASSPKSDYMHILENFTDLQTDAFTKLLINKTCKVLVNDSNEERCTRIDDVVFVIDSSSSIWEPYFKQQLEFVKQVVNAFDVGQGKTRIGAVNFSNRVMTEFHLKTYDSKQDVLNAISSIEYTAGDSTNTFDALRVLRTEHFREINGDRSDVPNIAILLTDGESYNMNSTVNEAKLTKEAGVTIFAIGIGESIKQNELEQIASSPKSDHMHILETFTDLQAGEFAKLLINKACKV